MYPLLPQQLNPCFSRRLICQCTFFPLLHKLCIKVKASYLNMQTVHPERLLTMPGEGQLLKAEGNSVLFLSEAPGRLGNSGAPCTCQWLSAQCRSMVVGRRECFLRHFVLTGNPTKSTVAGNSHRVQDLSHSAMPNAVCHAVVIWDADPQQIKDHCRSLLAIMYF